MSKTRLLVIDDSPFIHKAIKKALDPDVYEICGNAANGREGVDLYFAVNPDVVTMDITMPVMNGLNAAKEIIGKCPRARIIMLSAMGDEEIVNEISSLGISGFLQKPFKAPELVAAIQKVCQGG